MTEPVASYFELFVEPRRELPETEWFAYELRLVQVMSFWLDGAFMSHAAVRRMLTQSTRTVVRIETEEARRG